MDASEISKLINTQFMTLFTRESVKLSQEIQNKAQGAIMLKI